MIPVSKALKIIDSEIGRLGCEIVRIERSVGRVLAEDIVADMDMPPFDRSQMDGFAVRAADVATVPSTLILVGESAAGNGWHSQMKQGETVRIMTGAPVPIGADAVQKLENARETDVPLVQDVSSAQAVSGISGVSRTFVTILESIEKGRSIVKKGSEIRKGSVLFRAGTLVTDGMIAPIAAFGYQTFLVAKKPLISIMSTGSEIVEIGETPGTDQIRNSNALMLQILCEKAGAAAKALPVAGDHLAKLRSKIRKIAEGGKTDILVITGGVSVGKYDLTKAALIDLGAEIFFEKVRLRPGKPAVFAQLNEMWVFALPGNPVSSAVTFFLFVRRAIRRLQSAQLVDLETGYAIAATRMKAAVERESYIPVRLETNKDGILSATPVKWGGSSDFVGFAKATALAVLPKASIVESTDVVKIVYI